MSNFRSSDFTAICWATSEEVHHFVYNNGFRSCETLNLYIRSGIWGPTRHLSLKITNSLAIIRLRKTLKTQPGWPATKFEPGTSRMRVSCVTTEPPRSVLIMVYRTINWLFFKTEPLSGTARFVRYGVPKCPFHMSPINRTCAAHRAQSTLQTGFKLCRAYLLRLCRASYIGDDELHTHNPICAVVLYDFQSLRGLLWRYRSTIHQTLHNYPKENGREVSYLVTMLFTKLFPPLQIYRLGYVTLRWFRIFLSKSTDT